MNIYKRKHFLVKNRLKELSKLIKQENYCYRCKKIFWKNFYEKNEDKNGWQAMISSYLFYECNEEELKFFDAVFFRDKGHVFVCAHLFISERVYYLWVEKMLDDLVGLAMQGGLITIDISDKTRVAEKQYLSDGAWEKIAKLIAGKERANSPEIRKETEGMAAVYFTGISWRSLPAEYGAWKTVYNKFNLWKKSGLWDKILEILLEYPTGTD